MLETKKTMDWDTLIEGLTAKGVIYEYVSGVSEPHTFRYKEKAWTRVEMGSAFRLGCNLLKSNLD